MKHKPYASIILILLIYLLTSPLLAFAEDAPPPGPTVANSVILTEVQTGSATASDEFVELYNAGDQQVDISGWQVRYSNASSLGSDTTLLGTITGAASDDSVFLPSHAYYVLHTATVTLANTILSQTYAAKLSSADKAVGLFAPDPETCQLVIQDAIAWGASTLGESPAIPVNGSGERLVQRYRTSTGAYVDADNNAHDWTIGAATKSTAVPQVAIGATPGADNVAALPLPGYAPAAGGISSMNPVDISGCTLPPDDSDAPPVNPPAEEPPAIITPDEPDAPDSPSPATPVYPSRDIGLASPQITELLPNPASPLTDAADEFVELYNPNTVAFDLSGFVLQAGKRSYVFPVGTVIEAHAFTSFFSADTKLSLSNTQSQVVLLDPYQRVLSQSEPYQTAKDGQAWALAQGKWHWTTSPTPNSSNVIKAPVSKTKKATAKTASKQTSGTVKAAQTTNKKAAADQSPSTQPFENVASTNPLHPGVLALVGIFAILYGAYEYRHDLANKLYQLRIYREARREARTKPKGR